LQLPKIEANKGVVTQINVFTVAQEDQQALIDFLIEAANSVRDVPGVDVGEHPSRSGREERRQSGAM